MKMLEYRTNPANYSTRRYVENDWLTNYEKHGYTMPPLNPDTDSDSATDGQELMGYELTWMETDGDDTIQHGPEIHHSNPTDPHNSYYDPSEGRYVWRDLDSDGISDYNETNYNETYLWLS